MNFIPNGPMEIALTQAGLQTPKATPKNTGKLILVGIISMLVGGTIVYFITHRVNKNQNTATENSNA